MSRSPILAVYGHARPWLTRSYDLSHDAPPRHNVILGRYGPVPSPPDTRSVLPKVPGGRREANSEQGEQATTRRRSLARNHGAHHRMGTASWTQCSVVPSDLDYAPIITTLDILYADAVCQTTRLRSSSMGGTSPGATGMAALHLTMQRCRFFIPWVRRDTGHISPRSGRLITPSVRTLSTLMDHYQRLPRQGEFSPGEILDHRLPAAVARGLADRSARIPTTLASAAAAFTRPWWKSIHWDPHPEWASPPLPSATWVTFPI